MAHLDGPRRYLPMRICLSQIASAIGLTSIRVLHLFIRLNLLQCRCCTRVLFELLEWPTAVFRIKHGCFRCMLFYTRFTYGCFHARYSILPDAEYYHIKQMKFVFVLLHRWANHYQALFLHAPSLFFELYQRTHYTLYYFKYNFTYLLRKTHLYTTMPLLPDLKQDLYIPISNSFFYIVWQLLFNNIY